jgi:hypothetical protein
LGLFFIHYRAVYFTISPLLQECYVIPVLDIFGFVLHLLIIGEEILRLASPLEGKLAQDDTELTVEWCRLGLFCIFFYLVIWCVRVGSLQWMLIPDLNIRGHGFRVAARDKIGFDWLCFRSLLLRGILTYAIAV